MKCLLPTCKVVITLITKPCWSTLVEEGSVGSPDIPLCAYACFAYDKYPSLIANLTLSFCKTDSFMKVVKSLQLIPSMRFSQN